MKALKLLALSLFVCFAIAQLPAPSRQLGYKYGNPTAPVVLEMFADLECIYCGGSYPVVKQVVDDFRDNIYFVVHLFPLWSHRQAFDASKAFAAIAKSNSSATWEALAYFFANQAQFNNDNFLDKTEQQLIDLFATYAAKFGVRNDVFLAQYASEDILLYVDYDLHYGLNRGVDSTPTFFVNGFVNSSLGNSTTYEQWVSYLSTLIKGN